ncbi:MAG: gamma-glutamylcyclotransferase family protein [Desulfocapsaceae bacterium]
MTHIFTYGSLMFERIWTEVVDGSYRHCPGTLSGFIRRSILNEQYPAILKGPVNSTVPGVLYLDIDSKDLSLLDDFEGSYYERQSVQIMTDNNIFAAEAYVLKDSYRHILSDDDWDPEKFKDQDINQFLGSYFGFDH